MSSEILCIMVTSAVLLTSSVSPLKLAFSVALSSIWVGVAIYLKVSCVFPPTATVISFSSGMMIVFCYCAVYAGFESKSHPHLIAIAVSVLAMTSSSWKSNTLSSFSMTLESLMVSPMMWVAMAFIVLALVAINKSLFSPTKTLLTSY